MGQRETIYRHFIKDILKTMSTMEKGHGTKAKQAYLNRLRNASKEAKTPSVADTPSKSFSAVFKLLR